MNAPSPDWNLDFKIVKKTKVPGASTWFAYMIEQDGKTFDVQEQEIAVSEYGDDALRRWELAEKQHFASAPTLPAVPAAPVPAADWIECDACRKLRWCDGTVIEEFSNKCWTCDMSDDLRGCRGCDAPQEKWSQSWAEEMDASTTRASKKRPHQEAEAARDEEALMQSSLRNADATSIMRRGFVETPSLLDKPLLSSLLAKAHAGGGYEISNALECKLTGSLLGCVRSAVGASQTVKAAVRAVFGTDYFIVPYAAVLTTPPGTPPQLPHADDYCNRECFAVVQLADGQAPTQCAAFDSGKTYPTSLRAECSRCKKDVDLSDEVARQRRHRRVGFICGGCRGDATVYSEPPLFKQTVLAAFGELLQRDALELCAHACGNPQPAAGDGVVALPTLLHRGPGAIGRSAARHVLFLTIRPEYVDMDEDEGDYDESNEYSPEQQIHAAYLLSHARDRELTKRVSRTYKAGGHNLSLFMPTEEEEEEVEAEDTEDEEEQQQEEEEEGSADEEYEVEEILAEKQTKCGRKQRKVEYEVKWKGYAETSWEPAANLSGCVALDKWLTREKV